MSRESAEQIVRRLQEAGHEAVFAGGCVRDRLLGLDPSDHDVATSARPEEIERLFDRTVAVGRQFGVILVTVGERPVEVATFRTDGAYRDGRHPDEVQFSDRGHDAQRRDFTINAMFEDPSTGEVIDLVGGRADLAAGIIRAVGDPVIRFREDHLRMLRAVRFAARFGFEIEVETRHAIASERRELEGVSAERVGDELSRILTEGGARRGFELMDRTGLLATVLPEMLDMKGCEQSPDHHPEGDVFVHTLRCLENLPQGCTLSLGLGVLLHDIAKPACAAVRDGRHTFWGHTSIGAEMAQTICRRLRYSNEVIERVAVLVDQHLRHCAAPEMKASTLKRFLRQEGIDELLALTRIDALGSSGDLTQYQYCVERLAELSTEAMRPERLVTGRDLIELGMKPGPAFKQLLNAVEDAQLEGRVRDRDEALALLRSESERLQVRE